MKTNNRIVWIIVAATGTILLLCCGGVILAVLNASDIYEWLTTQNSLRVGRRAPDFELTALDGETYSLDKLQGRPILITFGATWCPPCREEAPLLQELHETHPGLVVLLIDMNESREIVEAYARTMKLSLPILLDLDGQVARRYHIYAIPALFFIDRQGVLRSVLVASATPETLAENLLLIGVEP